MELLKQQKQQLQEQAQLLQKQLEACSQPDGTSEVGENMGEGKKRRRKRGNRSKSRPKADESNAKNDSGARKVWNAEKIAEKSFSSCRSTNLT